MPSKKRAPIGTLAWFAEGGPSVYLVCDGCERFVTPDFAELAKVAANGWGEMLSDLAPHLRCRRCKHRSARITIELPGGIG